MFEKGESSNKQKMNGCSIHQVLRQHLRWFLQEGDTTEPLKHIFYLIFNVLYLFA